MNIAANFVAIVLLLTLVTILASVAKYIFGPIGADVVIGAMVLGVVLELIKRFGKWLNDS